MSDLKKSETYRGHDILFSPPTRKFLVQLPGDEDLSAYAAAFQARRAINIALDGHSITWPKRETPNK